MRDYEGLILILILAIPLCVPFALGIFCMILEEFGFFKD